MSKLFFTPEQIIRQRYGWFEEARRLGNVSLACRRLGISRKSFYKWKRRFEHGQQERSSLTDRSRRPHHPHYRIKKGLRRRILALREKTHLGPARLRHLLIRHGLKSVPSVFSIAKILKRAGLTRSHRSRPKRYRKRFIVPRPGDLVQIDIKFTPYLIGGHRLYQYTAIDCCTRLRLIQFSEEHTVQASKTFAQYVLSSFPFAVRMIQTDNDATFTHWYTAGPKTPLDRPLRAHPFTLMCQSLGASHRLIPPRTPRLNGKVERSHQTDEQEFYRLKTYRSRNDLQRAFARWLWHYNHTRIHMGLNGATPIQALRAFPHYAHIKELKCYPC